eukprot:jgi/Galph1/6003/GphlegSOOS_G4732.1
MSFVAVADWPSASNNTNIVQENQKQMSNQQNNNLSETQYLSNLNSSPVIPEESTANLCLTCYEQEANIRLLPCGHQILCGMCLTQLDDEHCPVCREKIESVEIYTLFHQEFTSDLERREFERELSTGEEERTISKQELSMREESFSGLLASQGLDERKEDRSRSLSFRNLYSNKRKQRPNNKKKEGELITKPPKVVVSLSNILEECKALEREVIDRIFQVLLTGSDYVDKNGLVETLKDLFPLKENWEAWTDEEREKIVKKEYRNGLDPSVPAKHFFPNMNINGVLVHLLSVNLWELLRIVRSGKEDLRYPDVILIACSTDRLHCRIPRFWVILGGEDAIDEVDVFTLEDVKQAYLSVLSTKRPNDFWYIPSRSAFESWYQKIGEEIVTKAHTGRLIKTSEEVDTSDNSNEVTDISCMDCLCI